MVEQAFPLFAKSMVPLLAGGSETSQGAVLESGTVRWKRYQHGWVQSIFLLAGKYSALVSVIC